MFEGWNKRGSRFIFYIHAVIPFTVRLGKGWKNQEGGVGREGPAGVMVPGSSWQMSGDAWGVNVSGSPSPHQQKEQFLRGTKSRALFSFSQTDRRPQKVFCKHMRFLYIVARCIRLCWDVIRRITSTDFWFFFCILSFNNLAVITCCGQLLGSLCSTQANHMPFVYKIGSWSGTSSSFNL